MKHVWIAGQREARPLSAMCTKLRVSNSGFRAQKRGGSTNGKRLSNRQRLAPIFARYAKLNGAYDLPRKVKEIRGWGSPASEERVARLVCKHDTRARHKSRFNATADSKHAWPVARRMLDRDSAPAATDHV